MDLERASTNALIAIFSHPGAALLLAMGIFAAALAVLVGIWRLDVHPLSRALWKRRTFLDEVVGRTRGPVAEFAADPAGVDAVLGGGDAGAYHLQRAWLDYKQTFVDLQAGEITSSSRAAEFFEGAGGPGRRLEWWSNIFVAVGLLFTFLGIVAALSQATQAVDAGGGPDVMQAALGALLGIAAAKFWTSVAGIGSSLLLRIVGRRWRDRLDRAEDELCEALDACVVHLSPQRVALMQLDELRRLNARLAGDPAAFDAGSEPAAVAPRLAHG